MLSVGVRVTDNDGRTAVAQMPLAVQSASGGSGGGSGSDPGSGSEGGSEVTGIGLVVLASSGVMATRRSD